MSRELIVNADDFGASMATNAGIIRAHAHGIVTSTSLMVCRPAAPAAVALAREHPRLSVGLHVDLGEWVYANGEWVVLYERGPAEREVPAQLERFRALTGRDPTHLDSHQHVHREEPARSVVSAIAGELGVPVRGQGTISYCGEFYGQTGKGEPVPDAIAPEALIGIVERLAAGITELGCHPGLDPDLDSTYRGERLYELQALCDGRVRAAIERAGVRLRPF